MNQHELAPLGNLTCVRPRRLRHTKALRELCQEHYVRAEDLIYPLFVSAVDSQPQEISSMPGQFRWPLSELETVARELVAVGVKAVILFGIPDQKDPVGEDNFSAGGVVQRAIGALRGTAPELVIITDVCMCEYTSHGHCGLVNTAGSPWHQPELPEGYVLNDPTLEILGRVAISHAQAGADVVAPSGMLDGMVISIRQALDGAGYQHVPIMAYSVKYASAFYGPFREAAAGAPQFGDRATHQMQPANLREALREARLDAEQGADFLMVKPGLAYLDVIKSVRETCPELPLVAYNVSGEYAMVKAAVARGWVDERHIVEEMLVAFKRAGADLVITYFAKEYCQWLKQK
jgi:porphobilinogen synthase